MKFKNIAIPFLAAIPVCAALRLVQMVYTVDTATGFFKDAYKSMGLILGIAVFVIAALFAVLSFTAYQRPEKPPKVNAVLGIFSILLGVAIGYEILNESFVTSIVRTWQIVLLVVSGLLAAMYLIIYGLKFIFGFSLAKGCAAILPIYFILRIICIFTTITYLSLVFETVITLASHCAALLFMLYFAKMINGINGNTNFRHLLASGICTTLLCVADALPRLILQFAGKTQYLHSNPSSPYTVLATGAFAAVLLFCCFSDNNLAPEKSDKIVIK